MKANKAADRQGIPFFPSFFLYFFLSFRFFHSDLSAGLLNAIENHDWKNHALTNTQIFWWTSCYKSPFSHLCRGLPRKILVAVRDSPRAECHNRCSISHRCPFHLRRWGLHVCGSCLLWMCWCHLCRSAAQSTLHLQGGQLYGASLQKN